MKAARPGNTRRNRPAIPSPTTSASARTSRRYGIRRATAASDGVGLPASRASTTLSSSPAKSTSANTDSGTTSAITAIPAQTVPAPTASTGCSSQPFRAWKASPVAPKTTTATTAPDQSRPDADPTPTVALEGLSALAL